MAAEEILEEIPAEKVKDYISKETWGAIEKRNALLQDGNTGKEVNALNKTIKRQTKEDKKKHQLDQFR